jgi:hypothetical protein
MSVKFHAELWSGKGGIFDLGESSWYSGRELTISSEGTEAVLRLSHEQFNELANILKINGYGDELCPDTK